ncbi:MAG: LPS export ABC transporter periplasmic protein LptC [Dysgonamonadaceae bacterium]|nr:LPS export ABC transporter periplasmic protein LptC [Dysgonamonadaceae bacterium]
MFLLLFLLIACGNKDGKLQVVSVDAGTLPVTHTEDVSSLISDSGITRYRLNAKIWDTYKPKDSEPYWHFPEKFHLETFDSLFNVTATIDADTAFYYEKREVWRLTGCVHIRNLEGVIFDTEELFWNQKAVADAPDAIYTCLPVKVTLPNGDTQHHEDGFKSDQYMHLPRFYKTSEVITFVEKNEPDSLVNIEQQQKQDTLLQ